MSEDLLARDRRHVWHPFTQAATEPAPIAIREARGSRLVMDDGAELVDGISSWWATLHGHGEPRLVEAAREQMSRLDHVLFAGATHEPAVALAEALARVTPEGLTRTFFSDDGSTSVEVALKIALQAHAQRDEPGRRVFVALEGGYHGDTFGAMSVGDPDPFFMPFAPFLFEVERVPATAEAIVAALDELGERAAGVILEPRLQGAAGMQLHGEEVVRGARAACDERGLFLIADEVMTGFGRTGALFSCLACGVTPDLMCLAKGLTGGMYPLSATLATEALYETFLSDIRTRALFHGHTFTGNPVGCAVALESLRINEERDTPALLTAVGARIREGISELEGDPRVRDLRHLGGMVAFDLVGGESGYLSDRGPMLRGVAREHGALLRPLGNVVYALPPACASEEDCATIAAAMLAMVDAWLA